MKKLHVVALVAVLNISSSWARDYSFDEHYIGVAATGVFAILKQLPPNLTIYALKEAKYEPQTHVREALHAYMDYWYRLDHETFNNSFLVEKRDIEASVKRALMSVVSNCHGRDPISGSDELSRIIEEAQKTLDDVNETRAKSGMAPEPEATINDGCD